MKSKVEWGFYLPSVFHFAPTNGANEQAEHDGQFPYPQGQKYDPIRDIQGLVEFECEQEGEYGQRNQHKHAPSFRSIIHLCEK